ncbi:outer-membrane lipoprotein carrier protein LolA [uncultured Methylobacterium sp.]|uniref:outer-membrane lipoprotein carrier protein LolA n=1 Tax=uncultured Methylobacterium sp. TaxID=157278 RepID=UPI0035C979D8
MLGRRTRLAGSLLVLGAWLAPVAPADAQVSSFLDGLFGRKEQPAPAPEPEAAPPPAPAKKPVARAGKDTTKDAGKDAKAHPTEKTGSLKPGAAKPVSPEAKVAAVGAPAAAQAASPAEPPDAATVLAQANAYFNGMTTLTGTFLQIAADGRRIGGKLFIAKPGRLRFDYDQPSPLEVVADGTSVAVRDRKLATQDLYFIAQTPLKFLLREKIDLARDLAVSDVSNDPGGIRISLEDRATLGGTSRIQLFFDADVKVLSQWRITDPQGYLTTVQLSNLQKGKAVDGNLFFINYGRPEDKAMQERIRQSQTP